MRKNLRILLTQLSGNIIAQKALGKIVYYSQFLMGIGSGTSPETSGEHVLIKELKKKYQATNLTLFIFDVGANKGQFLEFVHQGLQTIPAEYHAFEPSRYAYQILANRFHAIADVHINHFGLGKTAGEYDLFFDEPGSGLASLVNRNLNHLGIEFDSSERIRIETLDDYCHTNKIEYLDLLKLDVEGEELDVLAGGHQMFKERRIGMVSFEFGGCNIDTRTFFREFWYFFKAMNWQIFRITPSGYLNPIQKYSERIEQFQTTNFLAVP